MQILCSYRGPVSVANTVFIQGMWFGHYIYRGTHKYPKELLIMVTTPEQVSYKVSITRLKAVEHSFAN